MQKGQVYYLPTLDLYLYVVFDKICAVVHTNKHLALLGDVVVPESESPTHTTLVVSCDLVQTVDLSGIGKELIGELPEKKQLEVEQKIKAARDFILSPPQNEVGYLGLLPRNPKQFTWVKQLRAALAAKFEQLHPLVKAEGRL